LFLCCCDHSSKKSRQIALFVAFVDFVAFGVWRDVNAAHSTHCTYLVVFVLAYGAVIASHCATAQTPWMLLLPVVLRMPLTVLLALVVFAAWEYH
jgi:hypothetical protein